MVDVHHAGFKAARYPVGGLQGACKHIRGQAKGQGVCLADNVFGVSEGDYGRQWAERLFRHDHRVLRNLGDDRGWEEVALAVQRFAAEHDLAAPCDGVFDKAAHDRYAALVSQRPHFSTAFQAIADTYAAQALDEGFEEGIVDLVMNVETCG